ncbi:MAG: GIY-YIG nuclease family protein [Parcubacteria group bacterium]|nr:GIY-YIG nuclease family protein [Parcubacteria group bacterium]
MKPCVYILRSLNHPKTYVGSTDNLERRFREHNAGSSIFSRRYRPWSLLYREECENLREARKREIYFKSAAGRRFIKKLFDKENIITTIPA